MNSARLRNHPRREDDCFGLVLVPNAKRHLPEVVHVEIGLDLDDRLAADYVALARDQAVACDKKALSDSPCVVHCGGEIRQIAI